MPPLLSVSTFRKATSLSTTLAVFRVCGPLGDRMVRSALPRGSYTKRTSVQDCRLEDEPAGLQTISLALTRLKTCFLEEPKGRINAKSLDHRRSNYSPQTQLQRQKSNSYIFPVSPEAGMLDHSLATSPTYIWKRLQRESEKKNINMFYLNDSTNAWRDNVF
jgi:hypothetical protein